jgi:hypothetical protein
VRHDPVDERPAGNRRDRRDLAVLLGVDEIEEDAEAPEGRPVAATGDGDADVPLRLRAPTLAATCW